MKLSICIFACTSIEKYYLQIQKLLDTWANINDEEVTIRIFCSYDIKFPIQVTSESCVVVSLPDVGDDYLSAGKKQNLGLKYIQETLHPDFVFVCGTDTYLHIQSLKQLLSNINPDKALCIGGHQDTRNLGNESFEFFYGGAGFVLSRGALNMLYPSLGTMFQEWEVLCSEMHQPELIPACDCCISWYIKKMGIKRSVFKNRFYECNYLGKIDLTDYITKHIDLYRMYGVDMSEVETTYTCCHDVNIQNIISCHNMKPFEFDTLHNLYASSSSAPLRNG